MCGLKKNGKVFTSKFVGTGPSCYEKLIYRAAISLRLRNTDLHIPTAIAGCYQCTIEQRKGYIRRYSGTGCIRGANVRTPHLDYFSHQNHYCRCKTHFLQVFLAIQDKAHLSLPTGNIFNP